jgi:prepilin-type processing-associated H-X9-DG protein
MKNAALKKPRTHRSGRWKGSGFTLIHLLVVVALIAVAIAFLIPAIQRSRQQHRLALCKDRLRQIGVSLTQYAHVNGGKLPVADAVSGPQRQLLDSLTASRCLGDASNYYCPAQQQPEYCFSDSNFKSGVIGYYYYVAQGPGDDSRLSKFLRGGLAWPRKLDTSMDPKSWVMSDIWISGVPTAHAGYRKGVNYLMLDGSVDFISGSPRGAFH